MTNLLVEQSEVKKSCLLVRRQVVGELIFCLVLPTHDMEDRISMEKQCCYIC